MTGSARNRLLVHFDFALADTAVTQGNITRTAYICMQKFRLVILHRFDDVAFCESLTRLPPSC